MTSTSDEVGHTAVTPLTVKLEGVGTNPNVGDWCVMRGNYYYACECALKDAEEIARAVNSHDSLVKALTYALPLAALALDAHRAERVRCGHDDITFTKASGETWVGLYQREWDELEAARAALSQAKGGK